MRRAPAPRAAPVDGMAWLTEWELPFEGGYTLMSKCAWANGALAGELCSTVFGRKLLNSDNVGFHGRSLLDMRWVGADEGGGIPYLRNRAVEAALACKAGRWTPYIAADRAFRYCRVCLAHGYQSSLYQIDGLESCPIHREPLQTGCANCGAAGQRYAITDSGFDTPFHCAICLAPLAGSFDSTTWGDAVFRQEVDTCLAPIALWLKQLAVTTLKWNDWDDWHFPSRWHYSEEERRIATFDVLLNVIPPPPQVKALRRCRQAPQVYQGIWRLPHAHTIFYDPVHAAKAAGDRVHLYKAIRRYVSRRLGGCARVGIPHLPKVITVSYTDGTMQLSTTNCPRAQALALWRFHFEAAELDPHVLVLRPYVLGWPAGANIDAAAWASYLLASFYAAVAAFDAWRTKALLLSDADLLGKDRERARALYTEFAPLLSPSISPSFPAVTTLTFTDKYRRPKILIVGPPDIAAVAPAQSAAGLWCKCKSKWGTRCVCTTSALAHDEIPHCPVYIDEFALNKVNLAYVVPMNQLRLPPNLSGSMFKTDREGRNCVMPAENDLQAISLWLGQFDRQATRSAYAKQIEKALLWCVAQRGIALSGMTYWDVISFTEFLTDPIPSNVWLPSDTDGVRGRWSPFHKAPTASEQNRTFQALSLLFTYWAGERYIRDNPCVQFKWDVKTLHGRWSKLHPKVKRNAQLTMIEWGYLTDAVGSPLEDINVSLLLDLAYFAALKPSEIGAIQLKDVRRIPSPRPGIDIWSIFVPTRIEQRREVFLIPPLTAVLSCILPASPDGFHAFVGATPDVYLVDLLATASFTRRADKAVPPAGQALSSSLKPVFRKAAQLALRAGDAFAAERLGQATLFWITNGMETHLAQKKESGCDCWNVLGVCKLCPDSLLDCLPDRREQSVAELFDAINEFSIVFGDHISVRTR